MCAVFHNTQHLPPTLSLMCAVFHNTQHLPPTLSYVCAVFHKTQHVPLTTSLSTRQLSREPYRRRNLYPPRN